MFHLSIRFTKRGARKCKGRSGPNGDVSKVEAEAKTMLSMNGLYFLMVNSYHARGELVERKEFLILVREEQCCEHCLESQRYHVVKEPQMAFCPLNTSSKNYNSYYIIAPN